MDAYRELLKFMLENFAKTETYQDLLPQSPVMLVRTRELKFLAFPTGGHTEILKLAREEYLGFALKSEMLTNT